MHSICLHCGESIRLYDDNPKIEPWWIHINSSAAACKPKNATPMLMPVPMDAGER